MPKNIFFSTAQKTSTGKYFGENIAKCKQVNCGHQPDRREILQLSQIFSLQHRKFQSKKHTKIFPMIASKCDI